MSQTVIFGLLLERIAARGRRYTHNRGNVSPGCNKFPDDTRCIHSSREDDGFYGPMKVCQSPSSFHLRARYPAFDVRMISPRVLLLRIYSKDLQVYCNWRFWMHRIIDFACKFRCERLRLIFVQRQRLRGIILGNFYSVLLLLSCV